MFQKDKIKALIALLLFLAIAISYYLWDKEVAKYVTVVAFVIWLGSMYFFGKKRG